jgi:putative lipoprotein
MHLSVSANMLVRGVMVVALPVVASCSKQKGDDQPAITGVLSAGASISFDTGAQLQLHLTDVTGQNGAAVEVAALTIKRIDALPYDYRLPFDEHRVDATHRYTVDARVLVDGQLRLVTDTPFAVLTQGNGRQRNVLLVRAGTNSSITAAVDTSVPTATFQGTLHTGEETSNYSASWQNGFLIYADEERVLAKRSIHAHYQYKGGYLLRYTDSSPLELVFDDHGKPLSVTRNGRPIAVTDAISDVNAVRNRAALLRSHALAGYETKRHRDETERLAGSAVTR